EDNTDAGSVAKRKQAWGMLKAVDGVVLPGGFGTRGVEGKILAARWARESKVPTLGVCLGFQCMVIEHCRNRLGWGGANSVEFNQGTAHPVVIFMPEVDKKVMGATMRLGRRKTVLKPFRDGKVSVSSSMYGGVTEVMERHRHRW
ncbi:unnamed protein product, partial [Discosporangium mesarthrocarpum]